ncbi:Phenylacetic acid catabolic protein [Halocalculus aciditolerans]|uniref:Phenylacetate-CoA oxygenase subunit PaaA n=1 Tax=Halocalculus aciditolerans TaxID=1383812 RepID=A0A830F5K2_9EURY|nr:Phenylacetic acid catabolic protein [Halocalculus aciditolerans]GGL65237.1 phenylacetate-CoA oxygenase subunit PaaA [Halocalculus aciditolerans]
MNITEVKSNAGPREFGPADDLPEEYRKAATRMIQFHANSEVMGGYLDKEFTRHAPSIDRKLANTAKVQDEIGHAQLLYRAAETLGVKTREQMLNELKEGEGKFLNCFHYPVDSWYEAPMIDFFVDGGAMRRQATLKSTSWTPYAHAMDKVCFEEGFHVKHGESILRELMQGSKATQERVQETFETWWPRILQFFGPTNDESVHDDFAQSVGLKTATNDELRNSFLNMYIPKAEKYGLKIPETPRIYERDDGTMAVREDDLDWDEFWEISKNEYEGSKEQIGSRRHRQNAVRWVRDTLDTWESRGGAQQGVARS